MYTGKRTKKTKISDIIGTYIASLIVVIFSTTISIVNIVALFEPQEIDYESTVEAVPSISIAEAISYNNYVIEETISIIPDIEIEEEKEIVLEEIPYEEYTIQKGDSLWEISKKFYGNGNYYTWIEKCNDLYGSNRNLIRGNVIRIYPLGYEITTEEIEENHLAKEYSLRSPYLDIPTDVDTSNMTYYGNIHITGYDPLCDHCCGKSNGITASGNPATYYKTVACNSLPFGTEIYIEGYGFFTVEDRGGKNLGIDIACENHKICATMTNPGANIYIVNN